MIKSNRQEAYLCTHSIIFLKTQLFTKKCENQMKYIKKDLLLTRSMTVIPSYSASTSTVTNVYKTLDDY